MSYKRNNNWLIILVIGIILFIIYWHYYKNQVKAENDAEENEESEIKRRISNLEKEKEILNNHQKKNLDLKEKIDLQSEALWKRFVRWLITCFIIFNAFYFLIFKAFSLENILTLYSIIVGVANISYLFFTFKLFSIKEFIFLSLREYSYKLVAGYREAEYFESKNENIQDRIEQIELEIVQLMNK